MTAWSLVSAAYGSASLSSIIITSYMKAVNIFVYVADSAAMSSATYSAAMSSVPATDSAAMSSATDSGAMSSPIDSAAMSSAWEMPWTCLKVQIFIDLSASLKPLQLKDEDISMIKTLACSACLFQSINQSICIFIKRLISDCSHSEVLRYDVRHHRQVGSSEF